MAGKISLREGIGGWGQADGAAVSSSPEVEQTGRSRMGSDACPLGLVGLVGVNIVLAYDDVSLRLYRTVVLDGS